MLFSFSHEAPINLYGDWSECQHFSYHHSFLCCVTNRKASCFCPAKNLLQLPIRKRMSFFRFCPCFHGHLGLVMSTARAFTPVQGTKLVSDHLTQSGNFLQKSYLHQPTFLPYSANQIFSNTFSKGHGKNFPLLSAFPVHDRR